MKKGTAIFVAVLLVVVLAFGIYFYVFGGKVQNENFREASSDFEAVAEVCLEYYKGNPSEDGRKTLSVCDGYIEDYTDGSTLTLTGEQIKSFERLKEDFDFLWVTENTVIFWRDETKYYGLIYSDNPLSVIREMKSDWYKAADYHRINSHWYEIGVFGI